MKTGCNVADTMLPIASNDSATTPRNLLGSRKRKAYMPRNSGVDEVVHAPCAQAPCLPPSSRGTKRRNTKDTATAQALACNQPAAPRSPQAASSKAQSSGADHGSTEHAATSETVAPAMESLAATRSRRNIKPREKFDPRTFDLSGDCEEAGDSRSCGSSDTLAQRAATRRVPEAGSGPLARAPRLDSATTAAAAASPRAWLSALVSGRSSGSAGCRGGDGTGARGGASDEQRMFQEFRKRTCTAYTGVVVHCQNMKLEARVNMVSYFPQRERKISGGQIYIAYMTNPHQAAVVHDITASIMTAPGIQIYHNHHSRPSTNREVALERLNYLDTLEVNMHRGCSRHNDKDQSLEKKARVDAENRRQVMLSPAELKRELHCWVSHDARWMTFKAWVEDVLFESKLANMCLKPKIIDEKYLKADEQDLLRRHLNEYSMSSPPVFTHMYDSLVMEKVTDGSGAVTGYRLRAKRYRRRKPELRNGTVKWFDDKSYRFDLEDPPTEDDQRRLDIAWGVVRTWLRHYDPSLQAPPPDYDAVDANYYVTWSHFAEWVNTLLEHLPAEIKSLQEEAVAGGAPAEAERATSTRRSARTSDNEVLRDRVQRLQAVHDKFRAVVEAGERMPSTWSEAKPQHRQAFENFFAGWKPLPPSMSQPQRKLQARPSTIGAARSSKRSPSAKVEEAPVTRATTTTRSRATAQHKAPEEVKAEDEARQPDEPPVQGGMEAPLTQKSAAPAPAAPRMVQGQPACPAMPPAAPSATPQAAGAPEVPVMCMNMAGIADVSQLRAWAVLNGLGQAVPMAGTQQAQAHAAASLAAQSQQLALMQLQMQRGFNPCSVMQAPNAGPTFTAAMQAANMPDAMAPVHLPPHALFTQPQHTGTFAAHPAGLPQADPMAPSPFLTTLDVPAQHLPTAESLLSGSLALPPPPSLKTHEPGTSSVNDSARSCLTATGSTPTAIDRPTLSRLLSNPMFAVPVAGTQGCVLQSAAASHPEKPAGSTPHE